MEGEGECVFYGQSNQKHEFDGNYSNSYMNGYGTYNFKDGRIYTGEMRLDMMHGNGTFDWIEGYSYEGYWENGYIARDGKMKLPNITDIFGEFNQSSNLFSKSRCCSINDSFSSINELLDCFLLDKDSTLFSGECEDYIPNGYGTKIYSDNGNNLKYYGGWEKGYRSGLGLLYQTDERVIFGNFSKDKMTGSSLLLFNKNDSCYRVEMLGGKEIKRTSWSGSIADCQFEVEGKILVKRNKNELLCNNIIDNYGDYYEDEYSDTDGYDNEVVKNEPQIISKIKYNMDHCQRLHGKYCNKVHPNPLPHYYLIHNQHNFICINKIFNTFI